MITISLCMIVRDEEAVLDRCLASAEGLADEIIIVDTGSKDRTKEIAKKYTGRIFSFPWSDDFSAARNFAAAKAQMQYWMWLDADDVISSKSAEKFLEMKERLTGEEDMVMLPYQTDFDDGGRPVFSYYRERIVKNKKGFFFQGRVHEVIPPRGNILRLDIPIEHRKEKPSSGDRNLRIYEKMEEEGVEFDSRSLYYYGRELRAHERYQKAASVFREFLKRGDGWREDRIEATRQLAGCYGCMGEKEKELTALLEAFAYDVPRGETCCELGRYFFDRAEYGQAAFWYRQALSAKKAAEEGAFVQEDCYGFLPAISLCVCWDRMGNRRLAEKYNELAGKFKPDSPCYLWNKAYFQSDKQE